jgi:hypothetical protein
VTGVVLEAGSGSPGVPVEGATVRVQANLDAPVATTDVNGLFSLDISPVGSVKIVASKVYDAAVATNYGVAEDSTLAAGETALATVGFVLPPGAQPGDLVDIEVRLLYRRAWRALAVTKGWTETPTGGPIEIEVATFTQQRQIAEGDLILFGDGFESGDTSAW